MLLGVKINPKLVHAYVLLDPIAERPDGAWMIEYHGHAFLLEPGGGNPEPFVWNGQPRQLIENRGRNSPPLIGFDAMTQQEIASDLEINPALVRSYEQSDPTFPRPIVRFAEGPIWDREAVERWLPTHQAPSSRRWSLPVP